MNAIYTRATVGISLAAVFIASLFLPPQQPLPPAQIEKNTVVTTASTEVLDDLHTKSQTDGQQQLSGPGQLGNKGSEYGSGSSGTKNRGEEGLGDTSREDRDQKGREKGQDQSSRQQDRNSGKQSDEESRRLSDQEVEERVKRAVEAERSRWDNKLNEAKQYAHDLEQKNQEMKNALVKNLAPQQNAVIAEDDFTHAPASRIWTENSSLFWVGLETLLFLSTLLWASMRSTKEKALLSQMEQRLRAHQDVEAETVGSLEVIKNMFRQLEDRFPSPSDKQAMLDFRNQVDDIVVNLNSAIRVETDEINEAGVVVEDKLEGDISTEAGGLASASPDVISVHTENKTPRKKNKKNRM